MKSVLRCIWTALACILVTLFGCDRDGGSISADSLTELGDAFRGDMEGLLEAKCSGCHLKPELQLHRKADWPVVLNNMYPWAGVADAQGLLESGTTEAELADLDERRQRLLDLNAVGPQSTFTLQEWLNLRHYLVAGAPIALPNPALSTHFEEWTALRAESAAALPYGAFGVASLLVDEPGRRVLVGTFTVAPDSPGNRVAEWASGRGFGRSVQFRSPPTSIEAVGDGYVVAAIGSLFPGNGREGAVYDLASLAQPPRRVVDGLLRTPHAMPIPTDGPDRRLLISSFGHEIGQLAVYDIAADGTRSETVLVPFPGATESIAVQADGDSELEYVALVAQALESVFLIDFDANGEPVPRRLLQRNPAFGHSDLNVADIDADGDLDLLLTNGDNLDITGSPPRDYHGVRIYENDGAWNFNESYFLPLHGAYGVVALNFDRDPELEIAAVAYFLQPDTEEQNFVLLDRDSEGEWSAFNTTTTQGGAFCRIAAGDIAGDDRDEIVLGGCYPTGVPDGAPALLVLHSTVD